MSHITLTYPDYLAEIGEWNGEPLPDAGEYMLENGEIVELSFSDPYDTLSEDLAEYSRNL